MAGGGMGGNGSLQVGFVYPLLYSMLNDVAHF
jgi:hypothetical protein